MSDKTTNYNFDTPGLDGAANIEVQDANWEKADTAIAAKVDKKGAVALIDEYLANSLPADIKHTYILYLSYVLAVLNGKTSPKSTFVIPVGNGDSEFGIGIQKGHLMLKEGSVCVDNGDVAAYTNGTVHKLSNKIDMVDGKGLSTNDFTNTYKTKLDNLDTNLGEKAAKADVLAKTNTTAFTPSADYHPATKKYVDDSTKTKVINGSSLSSLTLTVSSTIPTTLAAGTICFIPEA